MKLGSQGWDSDVEILLLARNPKVVQNCIKLHVVHCLKSLSSVFQIYLYIFKSYDVR